MATRGLKAFLFAAAASSARASCVSALGAYGSACLGTPTYAKFCQPGACKTASYNVISQCSNDPVIVSQVHTHYHSARDATCSGSSAPSPLSTTRVTAVVAPAPAVPAPTMTTTLIPTGGSCAEQTAIYLEKCRLSQTSDTFDHRICVNEACKLAFDAWTSSCMFDAAQSSLVQAKMADRTRVCCDHERGNYDICGRDLQNMDASVLRMILCTPSSGSGWHCYDTLQNWARACRDDPRYSSMVARKLESFDAVCNTPYSAAAGLQGGSASRLLLGSIAAAAVARWTF